MLRHLAAPVRRRLSSGASKEWKVAVLAGDGIGPEVMNEAIKVLSRWVRLTQWGQLHHLAPKLTQWLV